MRSSPTRRDQTGLFPWQRPASGAAHPRAQTHGNTLDCSVNEGGRQGSANRVPWKPRSCYIPSTSRLWAGETNQASVPGPSRQHHLLSLGVSAPTLKDPFLVTSTFLAQLLEGNFSSQDKLKSGDRTVPTGSPQPHSPTGSIFLSMVFLFSQGSSVGLTDADGCTAVQL